MTANPPIIPPLPEPELRPSLLVAAQWAELHELWKQFPEPTWEDVKPDWVWLEAECAAGHLFDIYGQFVAVCDKQVLGTDRDELALRIRMTKEHHRHPERFVISFLGDYRDYV